MPNITLVASAADAQRVQAAATALGYPTVNAYIVALITQSVQAWEAQNSKPNPMTLA